MQIAQIAPLTEAIPPRLYGGTERVISWLTDELVALGHEVVLFASGDSQTSAHLEACWPQALRLDGSVRDPNALHMAMLERVRQRAHDFDLLHFHLDYYPFSLFSRQPTPFVTTLHGRLDLPEHQVVFATFPSIPVISISDAQRRPVPGAGWIRTIHHGLPERLLTPQPATPAYFAFLGRISPEKAVDQAIGIAKRCGIPLKIAAKVDKVEGKAENAGKVMFSFDLAYAGVFRILNVPQENLHPLVMIECPRLLFPFAREIIATAVRDGGFPPLMLDPVDFVGLYRQNMERQAAAQAASGVKPS